MIGSPRNSYSQFNNNNNYNYASTSASNNQHHRVVPCTYLLLAGISCSLLSWYTLIDRTYLSQQFRLFSPRSLLFNGSEFDSYYDETALNNGQHVNDAYLTDLFEQRRYHIESICRRRYPKQRIVHPQALLNRNGRPFNQRLPSNLYVSEQLKIVFCSIPKVASSNWYNYFDKLSRNSTFTGWTNVTLNMSIPVLKSITSFPEANAVRILQTYKKIMWVREPLQRLVSAWRDKLSVQNPYYSKVVGSVIIKSFRQNASKEEITDGYPTSLEEFFKYLKFQQRTRYDVHWRPYYFACAPCNLPLMQFDYVGHLESISAEAGYVIRQLTQRSDYPPFPSGYRNRTSERVIKEFISKVPASLVEQVMRNFYIDYELYGYPMPKF